MEVFPDSSFRPWRAIPRTMCFTFASGCSADVLMSLSFIRRTRDQSVLDVLEEAINEPLPALAAASGNTAMLEGATWRGGRRREQCRRKQGLRRASRFQRSSPFLKAPDPFYAALDLTMKAHDTQG